MPTKPWRLPHLLAFDDDIAEQQDPATTLIGLDEVGRGCCMGPVVAAAVCLPKQVTTQHLVAIAGLHPVNDSKAMTAPQRTTAYRAIMETCHVGIGWVSHTEVDEVNVHQASLLAAVRAYQQLVHNHAAIQHSAHHLLMDGRATLPDPLLQQAHPSQQRTQQAIIKGDGQSYVIAAASIVAKHTRDMWVSDIATHYPGYGWESNMGYPTPHHKAALLAQGVTPYHRLSYKPVQAALQANKQASLLTPSH